MGDGKCGLKIIFRAGTGINFMAAGTITAVGARIYFPVELREVGCRGEFLTEVDLIEPVGR